METITANKTNKVQTKTLHGRDYFVAPVTMIVPGVLNGSKGPLYYPADEISKNPSLWNHMPIVVNHPYENGNPISARYPTILNEQGIGLVMNAAITDEKLVAEGWFDVEQTRKVDERVYASLAANLAIELSTGLFNSFDEAPAGATFNGKSYEYVARDYQPDHLAVLPDEIGACSIKDGCGIFVNSKNLLQDVTDIVGLVLNQPSHEMLRDNLNKLIQTKFGNAAWIVEVFNSYLIYELSDKLFRIGYSADLRTDNSITLAETSPVEVVRKVSYRKITHNLKRRSNMDLSQEQKTDLTTYLITNACCWKEDDRAMLLDLADETLQGLVDNAKKEKANEVIANTAKEGFKDAAGNSHKLNVETGKWEMEAAKKEVVTTTNTIPTKPKTLEEYLANAPQEVQSVVNNALRFEAQQKAELIQKIVANVDEDVKSPLTQRLQDKTLEELQDMELVLPKSVETTTNNYVGATGGIDIAKAKDVVGEPLPMPTINWGEKQD